MIKKIISILLILTATTVSSIYLLTTDMTCKIEKVSVNEISTYAPRRSAVPEVIDLDTQVPMEEMQDKMADIDTVLNKKEWFLDYKEIVTEYSDIFDPPETIYDYYTETELDLLFHVVQAEIGDEYSFEQKCNVASVIFNRVSHPEFGNSLTEVLIASQFATISNGRYKKVVISEDTILACEYAFMIEDTTEGCLFFDSNRKLKYEFAFNDGAHNFYILSEE